LAPVRHYSTAVLYLVSWDRGVGDRRRGGSVKLHAVPIAKHGSNLKTVDMVAPVAHKLVNTYSIMMTMAPRLCQRRTTREMPPPPPKNASRSVESSQTQTHQRGLGPRLVDLKTQNHHRHRDKQPPLMTAHDIYVSRVLPFQY
jgi:hypothetical protein